MNLFSTLPFWRSALATLTSSTFAQSQLCAWSFWVTITEFNQFCTKDDELGPWGLTCEDPSFHQGFYAKKAAALVQMQEPAGPPPPPGFEAYKKNAAAGGVMGMIQQIINDAKAMEAETIRSEEDAQKAYEDFVKDTNGSIEAKSKDIVNKSETKAQAEGDRVEAKEDKEAVMLELEQLSNYKAELHSSCDFVMKNFEIRQTARDEEIEALKQAKAILSGAKFEAFLQSA